MAGTLWGRDAGIVPEYVTLGILVASYLVMNREPRLKYERRLCKHCLKVQTRALEF